MASIQAEVKLRVVAARVDALGGLHLAHLGHEHFLSHQPILRVGINGRGFDRIETHVEQVAAGESVRRESADRGGRPLHFSRDEAVLSRDTAEDG
jgi:hypothetical protein